MQVNQVANSIALAGEFVVKVVRSDGRIEERIIPNIVTRYGLNLIAARAISPTGTAASWANYLGVGTATAAGSLDTGPAMPGEVSRKIGNIVTTSAEFFMVQATWGGAADSLTSVALDGAAIFNHASSGAGSLWNYAVGLGTTLGNSDFLNLTARIRVGSHNLGAGFL